MALTLSKESQIVVVGAGLIGKITGWDYSEQDTQVDISSFDSTEREFLNIDKIDGDINIEAQFDLSDVGQDGMVDALGSSPLTIRLYPEGFVAASGRPVIEMSILSSTHSVTASGLEDVIAVCVGGKILTISEGVIT